MRITNKQIYDELVDFRAETRKQLDELNGRVRANAEAVGIALDRTKRIGQEVNHHVDDDDAHGGGSAKIAASGSIKVALIGALGGFVSGLIPFIASILTQ